MAQAGESAFGEHREGSSAPPALRSPLILAVLGLVIEKPSHGYEIARRFEDRFGPFIRAGSSSVYRTLGHLARDGLIEAMAAEDLPAVGHGARQGASYRATREGARAYRMRLAERMHADPERVEILARLTLAGINSIDAAFEFLVGFEQKCEKEAKTLVPPPREEGPPSDGVAVLVQRLLVDQRRRAIDADRAWIAYARAELRAAKEALSPSGEELL